MSQEIIEKITLTIKSLFCTLNQPILPIDRTPRILIRIEANANVEPLDCGGDEEDVEHNHIYLGGDCGDSAALQMSDLTMCPLSFLVSSIQRSSDLF